jgi:hypothetical protein
VDQQFTDDIGRASPAVWSNGGEGTMPGGPHAGMSAERQNFLSDHFTVRSPHPSLVIPAAAHSASSDSMERSCRLGPSWPMSILPLASGEETLHSAAAVRVDCPSSSGATPLGVAICELMHSKLDLVWDRGQHQPTRRRAARQQKQKEGAKTRMSRVKTRS